MIEKNMITAERKAKAIDLLGGECVNCGTIERLSFDHINNDRQDKAHTITALLRGAWSHVVSELAKCQLLCLSCHAKKTAREHGKGPSSHGTIARYNNERCRCRECNQQNATRSRAYRSILKLSNAK